MVARVYSSWLPTEEVLATSWAHYRLRNLIVFALVSVLSAYKASLAATDNPANPLVGAHVPEFAEISTTGAPLSPSIISQNAAVVMDFVAPNCGYSKKQVEQLEKLRNRYANVRFVLISETLAHKKFSKADAEAALRAMGWTGEMAYDPENSIGALFKVTNYPTMFVIDSKGTVISAFVGWDDEEAQLERGLKLAGVQSLAQPSSATPPSKSSEKTIVAPANKSTQPAGTTAPNGTRPPPPAVAPKAKRNGP